MTPNVLHGAEEPFAIFVAKNLQINCLQILWFSCAPSHTQINQKTTSAYFAKEKTNLFCKHLFASKKWKQRNKVTDTPGKKLKLTWKKLHSKLSIPTTVWFSHILKRISICKQRVFHTKCGKNNYLGVFEQNENSKKNLKGKHPTTNKVHVILSTCFKRAHTIWIHWKTQGDSMWWGE